VTHVKKGIHASKYGVHGEHLSMFVTQRVQDLRQQVQLAIDSVALHGRHVVVGLVKGRSSSLFTNLFGHFIKSSLK
jgi:hypothetical protein